LGTLAIYQSCNTTINIGGQEKDFLFYTRIVYLGGLSELTKKARTSKIITYSSCLLLLLLINSFGIQTISKNSVFSASGISDEKLVEEFSPDNLVYEPYYRYYDIAVDEDEYTYLLVPGGIEVYFNIIFPNYAGQYIGNDSYKQIIYSDEHLYLRTPKGFQIVHQIEMNYWELKSNFVTNLSSNYYLVDMQYENSFVYLFYYNNNEDKECIQVIQTLNKTNPLINTTYIWSIDHYQSYSKFFFEDSYYYVARQSISNLDFGYLEIFDLNNISSPMKIAQYNASVDEGFTGLFVKDDLCFLNRYEGTYAFLDVLDVSDRSNPILISSFSEDKYYFPVIIVEDNYAYTACCEYINILDISQPTNIELVSHYELRSQGAYRFLKGNFFDGALQNDILHLIKDAYSDDHCYFVFDCRDPNNPDQVFPRGEIFFGDDIQRLMINYLLIGIGTSIGVFGIIITPYIIVTRRKIKELKNEISNVKEEIEQ